MPELFFWVNTTILYHMHVKTILPMYEGPCVLFMSRKQKYRQLPIKNGITEM